MQEILFFAFFDLDYVLPCQLGEPFALKPETSISTGELPSQDVELDPAHGLDQEFQALRRQEGSRGVDGHAAVRKHRLISDENLRNSRASLLSAFQDCVNVIPCCYNYPNTGPSA